MAEVVYISDDDDDIAFVGSSRLTIPVLLDDSDDEVAPDILDLLNSSSTAELVDLSTPVDRKGKRKALSPARTTQIPNILSILDEPPDRLPFESASVAVERKKRKSSGEGSQPKQKKKIEVGSAAREEKEALKADGNRQKQLQKDAAKAAKEAEKSYQRKLVEVNKLRISKQETVREIHLHLSADLELASSPIAGALPEIRTRLTENSSQIHFSPDSDSPIPGVIRFKRHLQARWDSRGKRFVPLDDPHWIWENTVVVVATAEEVVDRIAAGGGMLASWVGDVRLALHLGDGQLFLIIKGLQKYHSTTKSRANKEFTAAARAGLAGTSNGSMTHSSRPSRETVELELVKLQVAEGCFMVHVEKTEDIEDWVFNLAADIALRPYKLLSKSHLNFCPSDSVKKGATPSDVFELMLQEVQGITPSAAAGIVKEYPTFRDLMLAYEKAERRGKGEDMLQDCEIRNLKNGIANGRKLNKALSKRVYNVFRGEDSLALA